MGDLLMDLKKSLINPDEDFVTLVDPNVGGETRKYNDEDLERIKKKQKAFIMIRRKKRKRMRTTKRRRKNPKANSIRRWKRLCPLQGSLQV